MERHDRARENKEHRKFVSVFLMDETDIYILKQLIIHVDDSSMCIHSEGSKRKEWRDGPERIHHIAKSIN